MSWLITLLRRTVWLVLLAAVGGVGYSWWRSRTEPPSPAPPEWPPLDTSGGGAAPAKTLAGSGTSGVASASVVNALVDAPEARPSGNGAAWVPPNDDGTCPATHPIKANDNSGIFHVPGGQFYDRTRAERCYATAEAAIADGYRQAKA